MPSPTTPRGSPRRPALGLSVLVALWGLCPLVGGGCKKDEGSPAAREAPTRGEVGKVVALQGRVTWSLGPKGPRTPLKKGDAVRAEWTVHTAPGARLSVRLDNGHRWTLAGDLSKKVSTVVALTLPPAREGALDRVSDLAGREGMDRSAAAGLHHEMSAGRSAVATRADQLELTDETGKKRERETDDKVKSESPPRVGDKGFAGEQLDETRSPRRTRRARAETASSKSKRKSKRKAERRSRRTRPPRGGKLRDRGGSGGGSTRGGGGGSGGGSTRGGGGGSGGRRTATQDRRQPAESPTPRRPPASSPSPPPPPTARPAPAGDGEPSREPAADPRTRLSPRKARLVACLKRHQRTGAQVVYVVVAGKTGGIKAVFASGTQPASDVSRCLRTALTGIRLPRRSSDYRVRYPLYVR